MVKMEMRDEEEINLVSLDTVNKGEGIHAGQTRVDTCNVIGKKIRMLDSDWSEEHNAVF